MYNRIIQQIFMPLLILYTTLIALWDQPKEHVYSILISSALFLTSLFWPRKNNIMNIVQFLALLFFHWTTEMNWNYAFYIIINALEIKPSRRLYQTLFISTILILSYISIKLTYTEFTLINMLHIGFELLIFVCAALVVHYYVKEAAKKVPIHEFSLSRDSLTSLQSYTEFRTQLSKLLTGRHQLCLLLIDCADFKSINNAYGFQVGNHVLIQISSLLRTFFVNAKIIARYGGDEFAVVMEYRANSPIIDYITSVLEKEIPKMVPIQLTYGYALYPQNAHEIDDLISSAESQLFAMKRTLWLRDEKNILHNEKLKSVGEMAAAMAHEIRNPLTTVKGFLQMSQAKDYSIKKWYPLIMNEISRMSDLTGDFLQFSKPAEANFQTHHLQACMEQVIHLTESEATRLGHQIICDPVQTPLACLMDKDKIVQVLLNLIKNSFEAMKESGFIMARIYQNNHQGIVEIQDTGSGIDSEQLNKIFLPFFTTKETGTGLGLPICQKIIHDHNGYIHVESEQGQGTTFRIFLPLYSKEQANNNLR